MSRPSPLPVAALLVATGCMRLDVSVGRIEGSASRIDTGDAASIRVTVGRFDATTDADGSFVIPAVPIGWHDVLYQADGYPSWSTRVRVLNGSYVMPPVLLGRGERVGPGPEWSLVAMAPTADAALIANDLGDLVLWEAQSGEQTVLAPQAIGAHFTEDGRHVVFRDRQDEALVLWDRVTRASERLGSGVGTNLVDRTADVVAYFEGCSSGGSTGRLHVWHDGNDVVVHDDAECDPFLDPNGRWLLYATDLNAGRDSGTLRLWDVETGSSEVVSTTAFIAWAYWEEQIATDGSRIAFFENFDEPNYAGDLVLYDTGTRTRTNLGSAIAERVVVAPDGSRVAYMINFDYSNWLGDVVLWEPTGPRTLASLVDPWDHWFVAGGRLIVLCRYWWRDISYLDLTTGNEYWMEQWGDAYDAAVARDRSLLLHANWENDQVFLWDGEAGTTEVLRDRFVGASLEIAPDGRTGLLWQRAIAGTSSAGGRVLVVDLVDATHSMRTVTDRAHWDLHYSPDGAWVVLLDDWSETTNTGTLTAWSVESGNSRVLDTHVTRDFELGDGFVVYVVDEVAGTTSNRTGVFIATLD